MELNTLSDTELVKKVQQTGDNDALQILIEKHTGLCLQVAKRYTSFLARHTGVSYDQFANDRFLVTYNAALKYNETKGMKFSSFLCDMMRYHCLGELHKNDKYNRIALVDSDVLDFLSNRGASKQFKQEDVDFVIGILDSLKDKRIKRIFEERYFNCKEKNRKKSWKDIGRVLHLSHEAVRMMHSRAIDFLRAKMKDKASLVDI